MSNAIFGETVGFSTFSLFFETIKIRLENKFSAMKKIYAPEG